MNDNEFFVVDMVSCSSTGEVINSLTLALETLNHTGKKIVLKLNDSYLNQSQMLSIQALIASYGCILDTVETTNPQTAKIVENMNIFVQEPIEKRVDSKYETLSGDGFEKFSLDKSKDDISVKEVNGLHFEADLDAIQKKQESINISKDLEMAGISPSADFNTIGEQVSQKYSKPEEVLKSFDKFTNFAINPEIQAEMQSLSASVEGLKENSENNISENFDSTISSEAEDVVESPEKTDTTYHFESEPTFTAQDDSIKNMESQTTVEVEAQPENTEKNSIGVYKKAYDEFAVEKDDWEEVDFYETPTNEPVVSDSKNTVYINQTLRSGQILESDGNVVIIGDCHPGSEIRAVGDITVWGVLSGIAHAGCKGNINAKVRALKMNAVQLRIGNCYSRRPDGTNIPYIIKTSVFTPEEARAVDGEIMLFKINQN